MEKIKVAIADDHELVAKLLSEYISSEDNYEVISVSRDGAQVLENIDIKKPDVLLLDAIMPGTDIRDLIKKLKKKTPDTKVVILTGENNPKFIQSILKLGVNGFLLKSDSKEEILNSIKQVLIAKNYCSVSTIDIILNDFGNHENDEMIEAREKLDTLTDREKGIIKYLNQENTSSEVAKLLEISPRTVETHRKNILKKLEVKSTVGIIRMIYKSGMHEDFE